MVLGICGEVVADCLAIAAFFTGHLNATAGWSPPQLQHLKVVEGQLVYLCPFAEHLEQVSSVSWHMFVR